MTWAAAATLFVSVFVLRLSGGTVEDAYSMLYVFPVALVAFAFGLRKGAAAGVLAVLLIVVWAAIRDVSLDPAGWASRILPILLLGLLLGEASDRLRRNEAEFPIILKASRVQAVSPWRGQAFGVAGIEEPEVRVVDPDPRGEHGRDNDRLHGPGRHRDHQLADQPGGAATGDRGLEVVAQGIESCSL